MVINKRSRILTIGAAVIATLLVVVGVFFLFDFSVKPMMANDRGNTKELTMKALTDAEASAESANVAAKSARKAAESTKDTADSANRASLDANKSASDAAKNAFDAGEQNRLQK